MKKKHPKIGNPISQKNHQKSRNRGCSQTMKSGFSQFSTDSEVVVFFQFVKKIFRILQNGKNENGIRREN